MSGRNRQSWVAGLLGFSLGMGCLLAIGYWNSLERSNQNYFSVEYDGNTASVGFSVFEDRSVSFVQSSTDDNFDAFLYKGELQADLQRNKAVRLASGSTWYTGSRDGPGSRLTTLRPQPSGPGSIVTVCDVYGANCREKAVALDYGSLIAADYEGPYLVGLSFADPMPSTVVNLETFDTDESSTQFILGTVAGIAINDGCVVVSTDICERSAPWQCESALVVLELDRTTLKLVLSYTLPVAFGHLLGGYRPRGLHVGQSLAVNKASGAVAYSIWNITTDYSRDTTVQGFVRGLGSPHDFKCGPLDYPGFDQSFAFQPFGEEVIAVGGDMNFAKLCQWKQSSCICQDIISDWSRLGSVSVGPIAFSGMSNLMALGMRTNIPAPEGYKGFVVYVDAP